MRVKLALRSALVVGVATVAWYLSVHYDLIAHIHISDLLLYEQTGRAVIDGQVPYRDFTIEYPPGAVFAFFLMWLIPMQYMEAAGVVMFAAMAATAVFAVLIARALGMNARRQLLAGIGVALTPLLLGDFIETRFDLLVAVVMGAMMLAAVRERFRWAWVLLAVAVLLKLLPIALVPLLFIWQRSRRPLAPTIRDTAVGAGVVAVGFLPFVLVGWNGIHYLLRYHMDRPLQIESMGASYLLGLAKLTGRPISHTFSFGSHNLVGSGADVLASASSALQLVGIVVVSLAFALAVRRSPRAHVFVAAVATMLSLLLATGKVLSPQFVVWLLPTCAVVGGRYGRHAFWLLMGVLVLTQWEFLYQYSDLVAGHAGAVTLLVLRNLTLIALVAACWPRADQAGRLNGRMAVAKPSAPASITAP